MTKLLKFDEPKKTKSTKEWKESYSFEDGPAGGYMPNLSQEDQERWKAKRFNAGKSGDRIELRKTMGGSQLVVIVATDGWTYKTNEKPEPKPQGSWSHFDTRGLNVRMSMNGPLLLTYDQFFEIDQIVREAKEVLEK